MHGGTAGQLDQYWTRTKPTGPMQAQLDLALKPEWGNTATRTTAITVPKGTVVYEGVAAPQGSMTGGGSQVIVPHVDSSWIVR